MVSVLSYCPCATSHVSSPNSTRLVYEDLSTSISSKVVDKLLAVELASPKVNLIAKVQLQAMEELMRRSSLFHGGIIQWRAQNLRTFALANHPYEKAVVPGIQRSLRNPIGDIASTGPRTHIVAQIFERTR